MVNLHNALSSPCIAILTRTDGGGALDKASEKTLLEYHNAHSIASEKDGPLVPKRLEEPENSRVACLRNLIKKLPPEIKANAPKRTNSGTTDRDWALCRLIGYRDQFIHFGSVSWYIERSHIQKITAECLRLILELIELGPAARVNRFREKPTEQICIECIAMA